MTKMRIFTKTIFSFTILIFLVACGNTEQTISMAPLSAMPASVQTAPIVVQESYQFAVANPEILSQLPCYCGCGPMGHTSNYSCYVKEQMGDQITFDDHALGCSICVDITVDTMRYIKEGKQIQDIKQIIDQTYSRFGPSNMETAVP